MAHKNETNLSPYKSKRKIGTLHKKPDRIFSFAEADDRLFDIFKNHGMDDVPHEVRHQLVKFYILLMENQRVHNFTRIIKFHDIAIKHFIDCLIVNKLTKLTFPLLDVGTGPGFPGIPLRMVIPEEQKIILAEGVQKRVEFLKIARDRLELKNLEIIGRNINSQFDYPVNGVITRAVEEVKNTLKNVFSCLNVGGKVFLMKGPYCDPEIPPALSEWSEFYKLTDDIAYTLPETQYQRRLLVFEKIKSKNN